MPMTPEQRRSVVKATLDRIKQGKPPLVPSRSAKASPSPTPKPKPNPRDR